MRQNLKSVAWQSISVLFKERLPVPTLLRKSIYSLLGTVALSDPVRNFAYQWAWSYLKKLRAGSRVCDIGSRDSLFPAFLAWRGGEVTAVEKDPRCGKKQAVNSRRWKARFDLKAGDFLAYAFDIPFDAVLSLFSLQHAGEDDLPAYRKAAAMLKPGGLLLSVCEYDTGETKWQTGREDGTMRIYGPKDVKERIEKPIIDCGVEIVEKRFAGWDGARKKLHWENRPEVGEFCFICGKKRSAETVENK